MTCQFHGSPASYCMHTMHKPNSSRQLYCCLASRLPLLCSVVVTGAARVALGQELPAVFSSSDEAWQALEAAAAQQASTHARLHTMHHMHLLYCLPSCIQPPVLHSVDCTAQSDWLQMTHY
jgi:hypothetical protein